MADERSDVADLDLVEARVHLAAAQYHNSLANGKLVPRPPGLPRSRPASAGARVCVRPGSAPLQRRGSQELRAEGAQDALGVLLGPWGNCCYQAPPGIITRTLHDIAEMLRVSATRRERRKNLVITCRQKFLPSTESMERLHASIIGRSLGRSFAHVLLMTKVLMGFREAVHTARLSNALQRRTGWLRSEKCQPDERCLEFHFQHWRHYTTSSLQQRAAEAEILRGRESVLEVFAQGRDELSRAVELLYDRSLVELLLVCMAAWRDALRLLSLEGYGYHLASTRERTPWWVEDLFLLPAEKAHLLLCLVCWAACCALQRQGRGLKDMEISLQEISQTVEGQRQQLRRGQALKERLEENSRRFVCRSLQQAERWLLNAVWQAWSRQSEATRRARQRLIRWLPERLKQQNALRGALEVMESEQLEADAAGTEGGGAATTPERTQDDADTILIQVALSTLQWRQQPTEGGSGRGPSDAVASPLGRTGVLVAAAEMDLGRLEASPSPRPRGTRYFSQMFFISFCSLAGLPAAVVGVCARTRAMGVAGEAHRSTGLATGDDDELDVSTALSDSDLADLAGAAPQATGPKDDFDQVPEMPRLQAPKVTSDAKDEQIQNLERSVLNLVNQGASPGMVAFVEELRQLVDGKMKKELRNQQNTTQSTLNAHFGAIAHCAQQDWREVLDVALGQDVKANASSVESFGLQPLAQKHRLCRWGEWQRWEEKTSTQAAMEKSKETKDYLCGLYAGNESHRAAPVGDSGNCVMGSKYPASSQTRHIDFLRDQLAWWEDQLQQIQTSRVQCTAASEAYDSALAMFQQASTAHADVQKTCNATQVQLDEASCRYKAYSQKKCELIAHCADTAWQTYHDTWNEALTEAQFLQAVGRARHGADGRGGGSDEGAPEDRVLPRSFSVEQHDRWHPAVQAEGLPQSHSRHFFGVPATGAASGSQLPCGQRECGRVLCLRREVLRQHLQPQPTLCSLLLPQDLRPLSGDVVVQAFSEALPHVKSWLQLLSAWRYQAQEQRHLRQRLQSEQSSSRQLDQALQSAALALERCQEQPGPFHCRLLHEWRQLVVQRKTSAVRHGQRSRYVQLQEAKDQAMLLSSCLRQWQGQCQRSAAEWRTAQAVRQAQQQMHRKTLDALRRRQEGDACALQLLHFGAWRQEVLHSRIARAEKEKIITRTFGQLLLDDEMLRSRSFYEWRNALHHARHDALHRAAEQEAEERKKEAHEQKLQVMRQAFRSSSEALLGSAFLGWHNLARHRQQHLARRRQSEQRRERKDLELERFALLHCVCAWHVQALKCGSLRRKRSAGARIGLQALTLWQLRGVQGLTDPGRGAFQAQLLELWHQVALRGTEALRGRQQLRARNAQLCREKLIPALDVQRLLLLLGRWRLHCHLLHGRRAAGAMVEQRLAAEEQLWMSRLYDAWRLLRSEQLHLRAVGTSCQNAREVQLQLRWRMLHGMSQLQDLVDQGRLEALLLRWRVETSIRSTRRRLKERAFTGTMREVAREELELCQWVFSIFKAEATRERHQRELERTERQVQGARIVQRQMADGWKKALEALQAEQLRNLRAQLRSLCRAWLTGARALVNARGVRRRWASVLGHRQRQRALRRMCLHWRWVAGQERHDARLQRCRKYAENCTVQLRSAWLMQQTFRSWQHARAYEELFRILSDTQADLARAAEATALAETAAVAAQQRNQQVTVRVLPPKPAWAQVPHFVHPDPERDREAQFQAPVRSLQKDIQRHYAQRLQDLRNGTATSSARHCSFEVNIAQQGGPAEPTTREAWR
ncbi:unnamed protein product [Durusdinium trenchii]|uniref:Sfi1 spindle body domain-containing protein n=1 Tax=Durusdinium trenchii TaxID=1381693 RepID=A0ABP0LW58_9DINO